MKTFARIENEIVVELLECESLPAFHPDMAKQWIEVAAGHVEPGYIRRADGGLVPPDVVSANQQ